MDFRFKQFVVEHSNSTMKVGTDAVLLGSWFNNSSALRIMDIGCGSGIISLIAAQRSNATIDAIDIHKESVAEAEKNFNNSLWKKRLSAHNFSLQEFCKKSQNKYDHILSNPPFFKNALKSPDTKRNLARHNDTLSFEDFVIYSKLLSAPNALLSVILPSNEGKTFRSIAAQNGYHLRRLTSIFPTVKKKSNRVLMEFTLSKEIQSPIIADFYIRDNANNYSGEYQQMTKEFYLNF
ncbi:MAG: methyltransferase [Bacteroidota bacterium]|nr:methyltransferase [Bacteroidota bacterium]